MQSLEDCSGTKDGGINQILLGVRGIVVELKNGELEI